MKVARLKLEKLNRHHARSITFRIPKLILVVKQQPHSINVDLDEKEIFVI